MATSAPPAAAHVAPAQATNNRYLKVTPLAHRVRIAYTLFYGHEPGAQLRQRLDANRDGQLTRDETQPYADALAQELAPQLALHLQGIAVPMRFAIVDVGLGNPAVTAGAFAIDMIAWTCVPATPYDKPVEMRLRDHSRVPLLGETEVRVETSPGIQLGSSQLGAQRNPDHYYAMQGAAHQLGDAGLSLRYHVSATAPVIPDGPLHGACLGQATPKGPRAIRWGVLAAICGLLLVGVWWQHTRRRQAPPRT